MAQGLYTSQLSYRPQLSDPPQLSDRSKWSCQPAALHQNHGKNIKLSDNDSVAEREKGSYNYGIVFTAEPVPLGCVLQVTVLSMEDGWSGSFVSAIYHLLINKRYVFYVVSVHWKINIIRLSSFRFNIN